MRLLTELIRQRIPMSQIQRLRSLNPQNQQVRLRHPLPIALLPQRSLSVNRLLDHNGWFRPQGPEAKRARQVEPSHRHHL